MKNEQVIDNFINKKAGKSLNMSTDGQRLYSYRTCIAEHTETGDVIVNMTYYSSTTSRQRNILVRWLLPSQIVKVDDVPMGRYSLVR